MTISPGEESCGSESGVLHMGQDKDDEEEKDERAQEEQKICEHMVMYTSDLSWLEELDRSQKHLLQNIDKVIEKTTFVKMSFVFHVKIRK